MLQTHLTSGWRRVARRPGIAALNVAGLALALASCVSILLYVEDERSYDRFHRHDGRIYRIAGPDDARTPAALAPALAGALPGVERAARVLPTLGDVLLRRADAADVRFYEQRFYWADASLPDVLTFTFVRGDPATALADVGAVVLSESTARRYFGDEDAMGRVLTFDVGFRVDLHVTGVVADVPPNAHFRPDFLASMATFESIGFLDFADWDRAFFHTYVLLAPGAVAADAAAALPGLVASQAGAGAPAYHLQPLASIHLHSHLQGELEPPGSIASVYAFGTIAVLILLVASVNFVNLATAQSVRRAREVGVRKVLGAGRRALVGQFLAESVGLALAAAALALPVVLLALPAFEALAGKTFVLGAARAGWIAGVLAALGLVVGFVAGSYPALLMAGWAPAQALRGHAGGGRAGVRVRQVLVTVQLVVGIGFVAGTLVVGRQLAFLQGRGLGFAPEQTVVVAARLYGHATTPVPFEALREQFAAHPGVLAVAATADVPGEPLRQSPFLPEGVADLDAMVETTWNTFGVDFGFAEALGLEVVAGRSFDRDVATDGGEAFVVNETAVRRLRERYGAAWDRPVGRRLDRYVRADGLWIPAKTGRVVGVVRDFHYASLHRAVAPLVMEVNAPLRDHLVVRVRQVRPHGGGTDVLDHLERVWTKALPDRPFEAYFLDAAFDRLYHADRRLAALVRLFTAVSLGVACLGLFGLAAHSAAQRAREIGIRKALGASTGRIVVLLSAEVARLVVLAGVLVAPLAYLAAERWLSGFAYRIDVPLWAFPAAAAVALGVALLTVGTQALRAAVADPVAVLRE